jgi:mannose-6-phosphate isomerase-like protein (cupin superfamily)
MERDAQKILVIDPGTGKRISLGGLGVDFKIRGEQASGLFAIVEHPIEPGRLVPPHIHHDEDEYSYVLEGRIGARIGDQILDAGPGTYVIKPRNVPHTFWNVGPAPARILEIIAPAGFERFFDELGELAAAGNPAEFPGRRAELGARYHQDFVDGWADELKKVYGLKLLGE